MKTNGHWAEVTAERIVRGARLRKPEAAEGNLADGNATITTEKFKAGRS
jgi:hypothetical protein